MLIAMKKAIEKDGDSVKETIRFHGGRDWLMLFGVGAEVHHLARTKQLKEGGHALLFDLGYFSRKKVVGHLKMSIDHDHPQALLDLTEPNPIRWDVHGIKLRTDVDPTGPIILVGMGRKARRYLKNGDSWEHQALAKIYKRFPNRRIIYRPKTPEDETRLHCDRDADTPIEKLLVGASLVVCRHSNVAVDATIAGVPFECIDGAGAWLTGKPFTPEVRLDFLQRLAWWNWKATEALQAWRFAKEIAKNV